MSPQTNHPEPLNSCPDFFVLGLEWHLNCSFLFSWHSGFILQPPLLEEWGDWVYRKLIFFPEHRNWEKMWSKTVLFQWLNDNTSLFPENYAGGERDNSIPIPSWVLIVTFFFISLPNKYVVRNNKLTSIQRAKFFGRKIIACKNAVICHGSS